MATDNNNIKEFFFQRRIEQILQSGFESKTSRDLILHLINKSDVYVPHGCPTG